LNRWTTASPSEISYAGKSCVDRRRFSEEQIVRIIIKGESARALAKEFGVRHTTIERIRSGKTYKDIHRRLKGADAPGAALCTDCPHWYNGCDLSIPEAGGSFAVQCSVFILLSADQNDEELHAAPSGLAGNSHKVRENDPELATA
jgi:hypothetical protein